MRKIYSLLVGSLWLALSIWPVTGSACGGFFCQTLPIDQAGEQIVFRQDGSQITAMVQIQFVGEAADFGWVVPVPSTPTFELGSNQVFSQLEIATRPQFNLDRTGQECGFREQAAPVASPESSGGDSDTADSGVTVESVEEVGSYIVTVISGNDPQEVANWLAERNFDLSERGAELLAPYIEDGMKFVAVELQNGRDAGDIQPLILNYESDKPVVPIRLTAVAAVEDMGVLVWVVGDARAVPENYLHVTPNYTRLNWYTGFSGNAYSSYQGLITEAMDEAGGQGFATDYAGRFENLAARLPSSAGIENTLNQLGGVSNAEFISGVMQSLSFNPSVTATVTRLLPLPDGQNSGIYFDPLSLAVTYNAEQLAAARAELDRFVRSDIIDAMQNSVDLLNDGRYLTRLFTTLSSDEMTVDPAFVFNSDMGDQALARNATLDASCIDNQTQWTLTLGEGTGRDDVVVIDAVGEVPFINAPVIDQEASWKIEQTADSGQPIVTNERAFAIASLGGNSGGEVDGGDGSVGNGGANGGDGAAVVSTGGGGAIGFGALVFGLLWVRRTVV